MANTPNVGLAQYTNTDPADYNRINSDNMAIDQAFINTYTSAARPTTNRFRGRKIYNSDTAVIEEWTGTAWRVYSPRRGGLAGNSFYNSTLQFFTLGGVDATTSLVCVQGRLTRASAPVSIGALAWVGTSIIVPAPYVPILGLEAVSMGVLINNGTAAENVPMSISISDVNAEIRLRSATAASQNIATSSAVYVNMTYAAAV